MKELKLPRPGWGTGRILLALWENQGPMSTDALCSIAKVSRHSLWNAADIFELRTGTYGVYALPQDYIDHFENTRMPLDPKVEKVVGQIATQRFNSCWTKPMTGYAASLSRYIGRQA